MTDGIPQGRERAEAIRQLAEWMNASRFTVVLTGAGMSTESGIPDFRSAGGWWKQIDPRTVATVEALEHEYPLFHEFYKMRIEALRHCRPHRGHERLAEWERSGRVHAVATQNVDGLHQQAGSQTVYELHGSIRTVRCQRCGRPAKMQAFLDRAACESCGGRLRPDVVLFGEMLPEDAWDQALTAVKRADLVMVIGTSLTVYPVNQLPSMTAGRVAIINAEPTEYDGLFELVIHGRAGEVLDSLATRLR